MILLVSWRFTHIDGAILLKSDFVRYWIAARLFVNGANPYSAAGVARIGHELNLTSPVRQLRMFNPPWDLSLVAPFGFLSFSLAAPIWFFLQFGIIFASSFWLWRIYRGPPRYRWLAIALPGLFLPVAVVLLDCQMTPVALLGLVAFLHFIGERNQKVAGLALALMALKPHLWIAFACVLLLWCIQEHKWQLPVFATLGLVLLLTPVWIRLGLLAQYREIIPRVWDDAAPAWGGLLRAIFGYEKIWLQYVPVVPGVVWALLYWKANRRQWDWKERLPMLLLVSFLAAPYAWTYDEVILLPVFIAAAVYVLDRQERLLALWAGGFYLAMNLAMLALNLRGLRDEWYLWNVPLWLMAYTVLRRDATFRARSAPVS